MNKFRNLVENILVENNLLIEGIEEVKKYFPSIGDEDFFQLLSLDPTYKSGNELGKYSKWILYLYNNFLKDQKSYTKWKEQKELGKNYPEPIKKSQDKIEDFEKLPNLLKQFDIINKKAKININTLKSISDLSAVISQEKDKGISDNDKVNRGIDLFKKSVEKGGKVVFKDNQWIVLVPETLESSVVFGDDTHWCTTAPNGREYNGYLKEYGGQYFINLDLSTGELYQFHFESNQFMDSNDKRINLVKVLNDEKLKNFYINYVKNNKEKRKIIYYNPAFIKYIKNPSEELQSTVINIEPDNIKFIENPTENIQLLVTKQDTDLIQFIENPTEKVQLVAVKQDPYTIQLIENPTEKVQLETIKQKPYLIKYIKNPTEKVKQLAKIAA